jgi:hypothetical protein
MEAIAGLVAEARAGWSPPPWYKGDDGSEAAGHP